MPKCGWRSLLVSVAMVAALGGAPASAETLTDTLIKAYQLSPLLESNRAALRALDENVPQARANRRPQVSGSAQVQGQTDPDFEFPFDNAATVGLEASLLLLDNGQTAAAIESARLNVAAGRASLLSVEQQVLFDAVAAYMDVREALELLSIARNDVRVLTEQLDATRNRFDVGEVTRTDVSQTEARLANSRSNLALAEGNLSTARAAYLAAVGVLPGDLAPPPPIPQLPQSVTEAEALALQQNPQVKAAQFAERAAVYDFDRARAAKGLTVQAGIGAQYQFQRGRDPFGQRVTDEGVAITGQLGASVPLYTGGRNDSVIRQAQQVLEQRKFEVQDAGRAVIETVNNAYTQLEVARASIVSNREQVRAATIAFEGVSEEARLGARSTLDVLDSDQERLRAQAELIRAMRNEYVAAYGVLQSIGLLTVRHLGLGIETYDPDLYYGRVQRGPSGGYDTGVVDRIRSRWER